MKIILSVLAALVLLPAASAAPAHADPYRWCADFGGRGGGGTSCYYNSFEQCRRELIGRGGFCRPNPFYDGRPVRSERSRYHRSRSADRYRY
ncbi:MAG TPA: DUF3551 domain-containing protein [Pseudolabrys sp.]|nr:DUF3551 domain-containing protein [Pseudolabrys sp.]